MYFSFAAQSHSMVEGCWFVCMCCVAPRERREKRCPQYRVFQLKCDLGRFLRFHYHKKWARRAGAGKGSWLELGGVEEGWPAKFGVRGWAGWLATACNGVLITIRVVIE